MELTQILKYVAVSYNEKPSFLLLMGDGKEYISNGCEFVENTEENRNYLIDEYHCSSEITELLGSPVLSDYTSITDVRYMFDGSDAVTSVTLNLPNATLAQRMFHACSTLTTANITAPSLINALAMFYQCTNLSSVTLDAPNIIYSSWMYYQCTSLP